MQPSPQAVTVTNDVVPNSGLDDVDVAGNDYWHAAYAGDTNNAAATSPCETLTVNIASGDSISTTPRARASPPGRPLTTVRR